MRAVPIRGLSQQPLGEKLTPTQGGKILGAPADKVFYLQMPDNSMAGYRIRKDDLVLMTPFTSLEEGGVYLIEENGATGLYKVNAQGGNRLLLQQYEFEPRARTAELKGLRLLFRARLVEFSL